MTVPRCMNWFGHKFEARYSIGSPPSLTISQIEAVGVWLTHDAEVNMTSAPRTYERDICIWCGHAIEKSDPPK